MFWEDISVSVWFNLSTSLWNVLIRLYYFGESHSLVCNGAGKAGLKGWGKMIVMGEVGQGGGSWPLIGGAWRKLSQSRLLIGSRLKANPEKPVCVQGLVCIYLLQHLKLIGLFPPTCGRCKAFLSGSLAEKPRVGIWQAFLLPWTFGVFFFQPMF